MKKNLRAEFTRRQYMLSKDFELYYYSDKNLVQGESHAHPYYEFYFFLEGAVSIQVREKIYPLHCGDIVLIPPMTSHQALIHHSEIPYRRFVLWISEPYCGQLGELSEDYLYFIHHVEKTKEYVIHNDMITFNTIQAKVFSLLEEIQSKPFGFEPKITIDVNDLVLHLSRIVYEQNHSDFSSGGKNLYQNIIDYIEQHLDEPLTLDGLAKEFYVSKYHICHIFKEHMGISIHQYILKKRLKSCKHALLKDVNISTVYQSFGFKDYSGFYRAFKKEFGISPKEFKDSGHLKF